MLDVPPSQKVASEIDTELVRFHLCHHAHLLSTDGMHQHARDYTRKWDIVNQSLAVSHKCDKISTQRAVSSGHGLKAAQTCGGWVAFFVSAKDRSTDDIMEGKLNGEETVRG